MRRALFPFVAVMLIGLLTVSACQRSVAEERTLTNVFRSAESYLTVALPDGWAAVKGPALLSHYYLGQLAFNSWGDAGFWTHEVQNGGSSTYPPDRHVSDTAWRGLCYFGAHLGTTSSV